MEYRLIKETKFERARKEIAEAYREKLKVVFSGDDDDLNRKILEKEKIDFLLINLGGRKDFQKQRNSGFNQVFAKLAKKNDVVIGINLDEIIDSDKIEKPRILARLRQNIKLCSKNKLKMKFFGQRHQRNIYDLKSLGLILGMPTIMTRGL